MALDSALGGLGNFDIPADTQSSEIGDTGPSLADILGNSYINERQRFNLLQQQLNQIQSTQPEGTLSRLKSPGGLATLLAAIGSAVFGGEEGQAVAAGLGIGALNRAQLLKSIEENQRQKAAEETRDRMEDSLDRQEKQTQRVTTLFQQRPEAFRNPITGEPSLPPEEMGAMLGLGGVPVYTPDPRRTKAWEESLGLMVDRLKTLQDPGDRRTLVKYIFQHMDGEQIPDEVVNAIATAPTDELITDATFKAFLGAGGPWGLSAIQYAAENKLPPYSPEVLKKLKFYVKPDPSVKLDDAEMIEAAELVRQWQSANPEKLESLRLKHGKDLDAYNREVASTALKGRSDLLSTYLDEKNIGSSKDLAMVQDFYGKFYSGFDLTRLMSEVGLLENLPPEAKTPEGFSRMIYKWAAQALADAKNEVNETQAAQVVTTSQQATQSLIDEFSVSDAQASEVVKRVRTEARREATKNGVLDQSLFEELFTKKMEIAREQRRRAVQ